MPPSSSTPALRLDNMVFLSNSVPKSASTFLFYMQQLFLREASRSTSDYLGELAESGLDLTGAYVLNHRTPEFLRVLDNPGRTNGPYVLKVHCLMNAEVRELFLAHPHIQSSLSIRDPMDIFFSAYDNYRRTGEFEHFATSDGGIEIIDNYFSQILRSVEATSRSKRIPIIRYEDILADPYKALVASLVPEIQAILLERIATGLLDLGKAAAHAAIRLNIGSPKRDLSQYDPGLVRDVEEGLREARTRFGYVRPDAAGAPA
jgi:hypothetical protein